MSFFQEFKTFASRGNAIDLAVGVVIGVAFGKVITSLVGDVLMPPLGFFLGGMDFSSLALVLKPASEGSPEVAIKYGVFINTLLDFLIVMLAVFLAIKFVNKLRGEPAVIAPSPAP